MASQWLLDEIGNSAKSQQTPTRTPAPVAQAPAIRQPQPVSQPQRIQPKGPVHGKLFSGNILSKAFDVLRLPEYAISSFNKGTSDKSKELNKTARAKGMSPTQMYGAKAFTDTFASGVKNIIPGIQNRTQYGREEGDYNAGEYVSKNKYIQSGVNLTASLGAPGLPLAKLKLATKIPGVSNVANKVSQKTGSVVDAARKNEFVGRNVEKLPGMEYFRNPEAGKVLKEAKDRATQRVSKLYNDIDATAKGLKDKERITVGEMIEGTVNKSANPKLAARANYMNQISDDVGRELVDLNVMSPETFQKYGGRYLHHTAQSVKKEEMGKQAKKVLSFSADSLKQRKDRMDDYIKEFQFPVFKAIGQEVNVAESVRAVKQIVDKFGRKGDEVVKSFGSGPRTTRDGRILLSDILPHRIRNQYKGVSVPKEVAEYIEKGFKSNKPGILDKVTNAWKLGKTIYSGPGYHARNMMSNVILSDMQTGAGLPKTIVNNIRSARALRGKGSGKMQQYVQEMKDLGIIGRTGLAEGLEHLDPKVFGQGKSKIRKIIDAPKEFQGATEDAAKLNVYSELREQGMSAQEAAKKAEEAIFSPHRISAAERGKVRTLIPFYSFTRQALPFTAKTAAKHPNRLTKYEKTRTAAESLSPDDRQDNLPEHLKGQVRLPIKDKRGNNAYFDPTYTLPYGNFGEAGGTGRLPFGLSVNPLLSELAEQTFNKDLYFGQPIAKSNIPGRANAQRAQHAFRTLAPNILPTDIAGGIPTGQPNINLSTRAGDKLHSAFTEKPDYAGRTRSKKQAVLDTFGLKSAFYDARQQQGFDNMDKQGKLKAIRSEISSLSRDQRLNSQERAQLIRELREEMLNIMRNR